MQKRTISSLIALSLSLGIILSGCGGNQNDVASSTNTDPQSFEEEATDEAEAPAETVAAVSELDASANPAEFTVAQLKELPEVDDDELTFSVENGFSNEANYVDKWVIVNGVEVWDADEENLSFTSGIVEFSFSDEALFDEAFETALVNYAKIIGYVTNNGYTYELVNCMCYGTSDPGESPINDEDTSMDSGDTTMDESVNQIIYLNDYDLSNAMTCKMIGEDYNGMTGVLTMTISNITPGGLIYGYNCQITPKFDSGFSLLGYPVGSTITVQGTITSNGTTATLENAEIIS